jgi:plastocyanin
MIHDATAPFPRFLRLLVTIIGISLVTALSIGIPACGDDDTTAPQDDGPFTGTIQVRDNSFSPKSVTISVGDSVTWQWVGSNSHTVTHGTNPSSLGGLFDEGPKSSGTFGYRFTSPGTIPYFCIPHFSMGMTGTITVQP